MDANGPDLGAARLRVLPEVTPFAPDEREGIAMAVGRREVAQRVLQALEAAEVPAAQLPHRVADSVFVALGSSAAEHDVQARHIARLFRGELIDAVEATVTRALASLGLNVG